ncbi:aldo/keto reductase [Paraburkholderia madseniana]
MPAVGFGTLISDVATTASATRDALAVGYRHFDCAERYRNEREVGGALQVGLAVGGIAREEIFVTTKLWNSNHRPERVEPAFEASLERALSTCREQDVTTISATTGQKAINGFWVISVNSRQATNRARSCLR